MMELSDISINLENEIPDKEIHNDLRKETPIYFYKEKSNIIKNANNKVLIDFLSPEVSKNEQVKRIHKFILIVLVTIFLGAQFIVVYGLTNKIIEYSMSDNVNIEILKIVIAFVSAYITSVVVELIAILKYVVKNVFDTSIAELIKIFKENETLNS